MSVSTDGAVKSVQVLNQELGTKTPAAANQAGTALDRLKAQFGGVASTIGAGAGIGVGIKAFESLASAARRFGPDLIAAGQASALASSSFRALSAAVGVSAQEMMGQARTASRGLISDLDIMAASNKALLLGLPVTAQGFGALAQGATALGRAMGQDARKSLDDLITGLGRGSAQILDNLGIVVNAEEAQKKYAASVGKTAAQLSESEKKIAVYNAALESMGGNVERLGGIQLTLADRLQQVETTWQNVYNAAGQALTQNPAIIAAFSSVAESITGAFGPGTQGLVAGMTEYLSKFAFGAVQVAEWAVTAIHGIARAFIGFAQVLAATNPVTMFSKQIKDGLAQMAADTKASFTSQMNALSDLDSRMKKAIETQRALGIGGAGGLTPKLVAPGGGSTSAQTAAVDKLAAAEKRLFDQRSAALAKSATPIGGFGFWNDNQTIKDKYEINTLTAGDPRKVYNLFGDTSKFLPTQMQGNVHVSGGSSPVDRAAMTTAQALQNLASIAQTSGSKLGKSLSGILGGASGALGGLQSLFPKLGAMTGLTNFASKLGTWGQVAAGGLSLVSGIFGLFKKKKPEPPPEPPKQATAEAWRSFVGDQQSKGAAGVLAGVSGIRVSTPEDMAAQASIASQSFWAMFKSQGLIKAADAFKAVRDKMVETFKAAGADDSAIAAMIGPMSGVVDLAGNESFRGAADGANGFAQALASIANEQLPMSIDQFRAFEQQAVAGYEQMKAAAIAQGMSSEDAIKTAIQGSGQLLTTLKDASAKYGIGLGGSQALFDQATAAGVAFGGSSEERLIMSIDRLTETLGGAPPKFEQAFAAAGNQAGSRISDGFASSGGGGLTDPGAVGDAIAAKLSGVLAALADRPIEVTSTVNSTINVDGDALASSLASTLDGGGGGASRMRSALAGRG